MDIKDLNLGDLVLYVDKEGEIETPCKINSLNSNGEWSAQILNSEFIFQGDNNECSVEECLLPISLTPEILEKNFGEFYPRGGFHCYYVPMSEKILFVIEDRHPSAAPDNRVVFCRVPGTYICDVNYVHELQHALRLCGIEKEIVL